MDEARFKEAQRLFAAKDYRAAAEAFLSSAGGPGGEGNGEAYHMAGNSLMRLRKYEHAVTVYTHAMRDDTYAKRSSVMLNMGTAQAALGSYAEALSAFDVALADPGLDRQYRVYQGRAGVLYKMRRYEEAARDYRAAAGMPDNPDRGKAYNNLGLALMALGKPAEAVDAYKAALASEGYDGKGKAAVNLGVAYAALGMPAEAVRSFEMAVNGYGHTLSEAALDAYDAARRASGQTGQAPAAAAPAAAPAGGDMGGIRADEDTRFFTVTDAEMKQLDKERLREERAERRATQNPWARAAAAALAVVLVVAACGAVFFAGYGWPTQRSTVAGMLDAYKAGKPVTDYWAAAGSASDVTKEMATIPATYRSFQIDSIEQTAFTSKVTVTITLDKGAPLHYRISLGREGVGWKVVGIDNDWGSAGTS